MLVLQKTTIIQQTENNKVKKEVIITAKTVDEAVALAVVELGAPDAASIEYTVLEEAKKEFGEDFNGYIDLSDQETLDKIINIRERLFGKGA